MSKTNEFKRMRDVLIVDEAEHARYQRLIAEKCDWDDPSDVLAYRSNLRIDKRESILDAVVPTRICPCCGVGPQIHSRQWVINKKRTVVVCRSCFLSERLESMRLQSVKVEQIRLFVNPPRRFGIDGFKIRQMRDVVGISAPRFAKMCGWSTVYQSKLENGKYKSISLDTADTILQVFAKLNLVTLDDLYADGDPDEEGSEQ